MKKFIYVRGKRYADDDRRRDDNPFKAQGPLVSKKGSNKEFIGWKRVPTEKPVLYDGVEHLTIDFVPGSVDGTKRILHKPVRFRWEYSPVPYRVEVTLDEYYGYIVLALKAGDLDLVDPEQAEREIAEAEAALGQMDGGAGDEGGDPEIETVPSTGDEGEAITGQDEEDPEDGDPEED